LKGDVDIYVRRKTDSSESRCPAEVGLSLRGKFVCPAV